MAEAPPGAPPPIGEPLQPGVLANLRYDVPAGLVVFLVALPLCLGIALASEAPLLAGIVTGVIAGVLVAPLSGSSLSVSGPAAGLTVIVASGIHELGGFEVFLVAGALAGAMQFAAGLARLGNLANFFPSSVVKGMLAAIGIILILKQIPHALGRDKDFEGDESFYLLGSQANTFSEIEAAIRAASPGVAIVTAVCLALLFLWDQPFIARASWSKLVPGPLVAVFVGVGLNELFGLVAPGLHITAEDGHLVGLPSGSIGSLMGELARPDWSAVARLDVWWVAATLAIIASLETLLSVEAADKLDPFRRTSEPNRELLAQGVGNFAAAFAGGLPMTAVIVRSSANIYSGGRTRTSAVVHGLLLGGLVVSVPFLLNRIPLGALAAVLLMVGYKLAKIELFRKMYRDGVDQFVPFAVTVAVTVFTDLLMGVAAGTIVGIALALYTNYATAISVVRENDSFLVMFTKDVSFLNKTKLRTIFAGIPVNAEVVIDGQRAQFIDHDILELIHDFASGAHHRGISVTTRHIDTKAHPLKLPGTK